VFEKGSAQASLPPRVRDGEGELGTGHAIKALVERTEAPDPDNLFVRCSVRRHQANVKGGVQVRRDACKVSVCVRGAEGPDADGFAIAQEHVGRREREFGRDAFDHARSILRPTPAKT
jgi:hypothetical protein